MLTPNPDPIFVRASIEPRCNFTCVYCPKTSGMENHSPSHLRGHLLTPQEYCRNLEHLARNGIRGVSFTGGEPTLHPALPELIEFAAKVFDRVELTTNGFRLLEVLPRIRSGIHLLKVSLDAVDPELVTKITQGTAREFDRAVTAIRASCAAGLRVGINVVAMRSTEPELDRIIDLCRSINHEGHPGRAYVSILDFYYSDERRDVWEQEFFPLLQLEARFTSRYGPPTDHQRFGCRFLWFDAQGVEVRVKDSFGATHRAEKCRTCPRFCQEGVYGLKHSAEGWVTTCPTGDEAYGIHLAPGLEDSDVDRRLAPLLRDIATAVPDYTSFLRLIEVHGLDPDYNRAALNQPPSYPAPVQENANDTSRS